MCDSHYRRWLKHGNPLAGRSRRSPNGAPLQWLKDNKSIDPSDECLIWPFPKGRLGYGYNVIYGGKEYQPHALMNLLANGPAPTGKPFTRHLCNNPSCVNPNHLAWGDHADNMTDMAIAGRASNGERHCSAKLTEKQVEGIRASNLSAYAIAPLYGVYPSTINRARSGKTWKHLRKETT